MKGRILSVTILLLCLQTASAFSEDVTVFVTPSGTMYHLPTCHHCSNECIPLSLAEALYSGYTPCRSCKPPAQSEYPPPGYPIEALALPYCENPEEIIHYKGFSLLYSEEHEQAFWVAYCLTREEEAGSMARQNNFRPDPNISTGSAEQADYDDEAYPASSGEALRKYARGHLAPHADMDWDFIASSQSYLFSNMSPQVPEFNGSGGLWFELENWTRRQVRECMQLYVVSGPVLTDGPYETIGPNEVSVPKQYFKVFLDVVLPEMKAVAFIVPNERSNASIYDYMVSVDRVEEVTGLDFFWVLDDETEAQLEKMTEGAWE